MFRLSFIFLLALMFYKSSFAQNGPDTAYIKALDYAIDEKYDSALIAFHDLYKRAGYEYHSKALLHIADIELKLGNIDFADSLYKMCLKDTALDSEYEKYRSARNLADISINKKEFKQALYYLDKSQTYKPGIFCSTGSYERNFLLQWKYSICLSETGQLDSAINSLTPFILKSNGFNVYNKVHDSINRHYYLLLLKKYDVCQLQQMVNEAISNLNYSQSIDTSSYFAKQGNKVLSIECSFNFMGRQIWMLSLQLIGLPNQPINNPYSKEYCINNIKNAFLYKYIMQ